MKRKCMAGSMVRIIKMKKKILILPFAFGVISRGFPHSFHVAQVSGDN